MDHAAWLIEAQSEAGENLIAFNRQRMDRPDFAFAFQTGKKDEALNRFETFLATCSDTRADEALESFVYWDLNANGDRAVAYFGARVDGVSEFLAIKSGAALHEREHHFQGIGDLDLAEVDAAIVSGVNRATRKFKLVPKDNLTAEAKREVGREVVELVRRAVGRAASGSRIRATGRAGGASGLSSVASDFDMSPLWVTATDEVKAECGSIPRIDEDALLKSAYAAGLKSRLGLHSGRSSEDYRDRKRLEEIADPANGLSDMTKWGVHFLLRLTPKASGTGLPSPAVAPSQPNLFSDGYAELFVSRVGPPISPAQPIETMQGRTVRLEEKHCKANSHAACNCGSEGLPEAVLPFRTAIEHFDISVVPIAIFSDDLRYKRPSLDMIRSKNAA